ncbi:hypothetical protein [Microvirga rosea]|uniref:hypothetical protein n=1 Tax=Microvirga rosea TaxID=2715425 RepID=UPI001D0AE5C8|nr:hypothetical protein [Microvirga rosea]MCB8820442.1 hypothetical protein [Microvirga rosea]
MPSQPYGRGGAVACPGRKPKGQRGRLRTASQLPDHQRRWWSLHREGELPMEPPYSVLADALSKYQSSPDWVQALWLVAVPVTVVGSVACVMRGVTAIVLALLARRRGPEGAASGAEIDWMAVPGEERAPPLAARRIPRLPGRGP